MLTHIHAHRTIDLTSLSRSRPKITQVAHCPSHGRESNRHDQDDSSHKHAKKHVFKHQNTRIHK